MTALYDCIANDQEAPIAMASGYLTHSISRFGMFRLEVIYVSVTPQ